LNASCLMSMKTILCLIFCASAIFQAQAQYCTNDERYTEIDIFSLSEIDSTSNAVYANAQNANGAIQELNIDVFFPDSAIDTATSRPFVLIVHGGGFVSGQKEDMHLDCIQWAQKGYVTATIEYRLGNSNDVGLEVLNRQYRAEQDARAAMRWIVDNASTYRIDTSWLFIGGYSAGSLISHGLVYSEQAEWDAVTPLVSAAMGNIDTSGNSLTNTYDLKGLYNNCGSIYSPNVDVLEMIPTVAFHKKYDHLVDIDTTVNGSFGSNAMHHWLSNEGICTELSIDTNYYAPTPMSQHCAWTDFSGTLTRIGRASCFFKSVFCSSCSSSLAEELIPSNCSAFANINENMDEVRVEVYPNPFHDVISISGVPAGIDYQLINTSGQVVRRLTTGQEENLSDLAPGMYYVSLRHPTSVIIRKVIKE
jgi:alpha/beta superfamily hydrolase